MFSAVEGEIIVDERKGHITFKHNEKYISKTKELEAKVNALLDTKNKLLKRYMQLSVIVDDLINQLDIFNNDFNTISIDTDYLNSELESINNNLTTYLDNIDGFSRIVKDQEYSAIRPYLNSIITNLKDVISLKAEIDEITFLVNDINDQKLSNEQGLNKIS